MNGLKDTGSAQNAEKKDKSKKRLGTDLEKAVEDKAERLGKSHFMKQVNKTRKTIGDREYFKGYDDGYEAGSKRFGYPCNVCGETLYATRDHEWKSILENGYLDGWGHSSCHNNRTQDF